MSKRSVLGVWSLEEFRKTIFRHARVLQGAIAVESFESSATIGERRKSACEDPCREPAFRCCKALESLDGFQSAVQLLVVAFNEVRRSRAAVVEKLLCCDVPRQQIAVGEDVLERLDLHRIVVVAWGSPTDMTFQVLLPEVREIEDLLFEICEKVPVGLLAADFEGSSDVFQEVDVAELDDDTGVDRSCCQADGFIVVADNAQEFVARILEFREELEQRLVVLRGCKQTNGNIVREIVDAVDERNLLVVALHCHVLPVHDEKAAEALRVAVLECHIVVVREP